MDNETLYQYALLYRSSKSPEIRQTARNILDILIKRDYVEAKYTYATMMYAGEVPMNRKLMFDLWNDCSEKGHSWAKANLAKCYKDGNLIERNLEKAKALYIEAWNAEKPLSKRQAHISAYNLFQICLELNEVEEAVKWLKIAADEADDIFAQYDLAVGYSQGNYGIKIDDELARYYFQKAADRGLKYAQHNYACMCAEGKGGPKDLKSAAYYWFQSYNQDFHWSTLNLALMYIKGEGVERSLASAKILLENVLRFGTWEEKKAAEEVISTMKSDGKLHYTTLDVNIKSKDEFER